MAIYRIFMLLQAPPDSREAGSEIAGGGFRAAVVDFNQRWEASREHRNGVFATLIRCLEGQKRPFLTDDNAGHCE